MPPDVSTADADQDRGRTVEKLERELTEAREQQSATAQILAIISGSPADVQPVFDAIASSAARLCDALDAVVMRVDGDILRLVAHHGPMSTTGDVPLHRGTVGGRAIIEHRLIHVADLQAEGVEFPEGSAIARRLGHRTTLSIPLLHEGAAVGNIQVRRDEVRLFTDKQIALLRTFADQAVMAIENARLFKELKESLDYQTATSEVLSIISRSPAQVQPVLDAIVENAGRLCHAEYAFVYKLENDKFQLVAANNAEAEHAKYIARHPPNLDRGSVAGRAALDRATVHVADALADPQYTRSDSQRLGRYRSLLGVPLLRDGVPIGVLVLLRTKVAPFSDKQIELVTAFADQAVIAAHNVGLFQEVQTRTRELTQSLEYQTATGEVLNIISRSATQLQPVLDTIVETAARLCEAEYALIFRLDSGMYHLVAAAQAGQDVREFLSKEPRRADRGSVIGRVALEGRTIHIPDVLADAEYSRWDSQRIGGFRTMLGVPLVREGALLGAILLIRKTVKPFSSKQIEMVTTFADQAVIAINNAQLFEEVRTRTKELQESLEYQTAVSDMLRVMSRSPNDIQPVIDSIAATARQLCEADEGLIHQAREDGYVLTAHDGVRPKAAEQLMAKGTAVAPSRGSAFGRAVIEKRAVHIPDFLADPEYDFAPDRYDGHSGTILSVPLLNGGEAIGSITLARASVRPFSDRQVRLVTTFADQAVIAMNNVGLFEEVQARTRELTESLEYQTATSEILNVISRSPTDVQPVFDTIAANALRLCDATFSAVSLYNGELLELVSVHNLRDPQAIDALRRAYPRPPAAGGATDQAILTREIAYIPDVRELTDYQHQALAQATSYRSIMAVPILRRGTPVGAITVTGASPGMFNERQIELLKTFADQAVIAIENTRLFEEVQARNRDLTALGEVGRAVSSTLDLKVVLKSIVERAVDLSGTDGGSIFYYREETGAFELGETTGLDDEVVARFRKLDIAAKDTGLGEAISRRQPLQIPDLTKRPSNPLRDTAIEAGLRAALIVPLLSGEGPLGTLVLQRRRPGEFTEPVVSLMQTFADQSSIALENASLFEEITQKGRELEIASQHKSQFVANMSHELRTPLAAILGYAELIQEGFYGPQPEKSMDALTRICSNGKHLLGLINTVLDIAKIESGQFSLNLAEYALANVVETVCAATESLADTKKLTLTADVARSLPIGFGDEQRLTQVLLNLVGNAIKFTDTGGVRITAKAENGHFAVSVADTGPGIPLEEQKRVFEQFHQVDNSNTKKKGGTGLGLAIAKQIIEMHGGRVWVESEPGNGAIFQMHLPVRAESRKALQ